MAPRLLFGQSGMKKGNVISLSAVRELKQAQLQDLDYQALISSMDKIELLDEMVRFQEERSKAGHLTPKMMIRGQILFKALEDSAETDALRSLSRSYRRHLYFELQEYLKTQRQ